MEDKSNAHFGAGYEKEEVGAEGRGWLRITSLFIKRKGESKYQTLYSTIKALCKSREQIERANNELLIILNPS